MVKHENYKKEVMALLGAHIYEENGEISEYVKKLFKALDYLVSQIESIKRDLENKDEKDYIDTVLDNMIEIINPELEETK